MLLKLYVNPGLASREEGQIVDSLVVARIAFCGQRRMSQARTRALNTAIQQQQRHPDSITS